MMMLLAHISFIMRTGSRENVATLSAVSLCVNFNFVHNIPGSLYLNYII